MTQSPVRRRPDVARLFDQTASNMPSALKVETRRVAERVFLSEEANHGGPVSHGDQLGPYRVERLLGMGGQAYVYAATHLQLGRLVALKVPRPEVAERLLTEGRLAASLQHPRIARVEDVSEADGTPYLVMELCQGSLDERLELHPDGLPLTEVRRVGEGVLEALAYAHQRGIVHRDVKPANVLFDDHDLVKLADLGTGMVSTGDPLLHSVEFSQVGPEIAGTPLYMSPEQENPQLLGGAAIDGRSDLFSFGKMLFLLLTGSAPRTVRPPSRLRSGLDPAWDEFLFRLLEEERDARFASAEETLIALRALPLVEGVAAPSAPGPTPEPVAEFPAEVVPAPVSKSGARGLFAGSAFLAAAFLGYLEVSQPTVTTGFTWLPLKLGTLMAVLFLSWFRKREQQATTPTSNPAALALVLAIGGWSPLVYALSGSSAWLSYQLIEVTALLAGLVTLFGLLAGTRLWQREEDPIKVRVAKKVAPPAPPMQIKVEGRRPGLLGLFGRITGLLLGMGLFLFGTAVLMVVVLIFWIAM